MNRLTVEQVRESLDKACYYHGYAGWVEAHTDSINALIASLVDTAVAGALLAAAELAHEWELIADTDHSKGMKLSDSRKQGQYDLMMAGQSLAYATAAKQLRKLLSSGESLAALSRRDAVTRRGAWKAGALAAKKSSLQGECRSERDVELRSEIARTIGTLEPPAGLTDDEKHNRTVTGMEQQRTQAGIDIHRKLQPPDTETTGGKLP